MPYEFYKILHFTGLILLFSGLVSLLTLKIAGVPIEGSARKFSFITHGVGLFFILLSGFGLLARLGLARDMPNWIYVKLAIWLIFGGIIVLIKRKGHVLGQRGWILYLPLLIIFIVAAYVATTKPF